MRSHDGYNPETTLAQMRNARTTNPLVRDVAPMVDRAAADAKGLWPDPAERETAGFGCLTAAATFAEVATEAMRYQISTRQVHSTGDILGIAVVERLDRIIAMLEAEAIRCGICNFPRLVHPTPTCPEFVEDE